MASDETVNIDQKNISKERYLVKNDEKHYNVFKIFELFGKKNIRFLILMF